MPFLFACSTYKTKLSSYYGQVRDANYAKALNVLDKNKFIQQKRNALLYNLEKGKLLHLMQQYDSSNFYFNQADQFIETNKRTAVDLAKANLLNPMMQTYLGEDFEPFMMHYYKALNYYYLGKIEDAVVEARRITLTTNQQADKFKNKATRYSKDAFLLNMQGMIYEANGDINNAFIAYRNAVEVYTQGGNNSYYGVEIPFQLKKDVIHTALVLGFTDEATRYATQFGIDEKSTSHALNDSSAGELVVFIEQGWGPEKKEQNFFLAKDGSGLSMFYYIDEDGHSVQVPFDFGYYRTIRSEDVSAGDFRTFRIAIPYYSPITMNSSKATIKINDSSFNAETAEDINSLAINILKERRLKEITDAIARYIVKKLAEKGIEAGAKSIANNNSKDKNEENKKRDSEVAGAVAGLLVNIINSATEKADTRNWQSLPAVINYVRVPLKKGNNTLVLSSNGIQRKVTITASSNKLQLYNWCVGQ